VTANPIFAKMGLFNWLLARLLEATGLPGTILHSADGADLSIASLAANANSIAVHMIDAKSEDPARAFFSRFAQSLSRPPPVPPHPCFAADLGDLMETPAIHLFAGPLVACGPPLPGVSLVAPLLCGVETQARLAGGRAIWIGEHLICSVAGLGEDALGRFAQATGARVHGEAIRVGAPDLPPAKGFFAIPARRFVHDGAYRAESDGDYSWLWTGPDPHFRLMIGNVPFRPAHVGLAVASEAASGVLERIRIFVNGQPVKGRMERWAGGGGLLSVALDGKSSNPLVLSVCAPSMVDIEGRKLGISIERVEIGEAL
jgi:hypothetical protein